MELILFFIVIGCIIGSFLNVVILRAFSGESIVLPPSKCPFCKTKLKCLDNIPILSYLFLRGKCRYCKCDISPQYPIIEALTGLYFALCYIKFGLSFECLFLIIIGCFAIILSTTDIKEQVVFDAHTIPFIIVGLLYSLFINGDIIQGLLGMLVAIISIELISIVSKLMIKKRAFEVGDTFIVAAMGAILGIKTFFIAFFLSMILEFIFILPKFFCEEIKNKNYKTVIIMSVTIFSLILLWAVYRGNIFSENLSAYVLTLIFSLICTIMLSKDLLGAVKRGERLTITPFGPPLLTALLIILFIG